MTLTEVLENGFLLPLMQEAWCRSWRQCVQTLPSTHALPHQAVPLEHLCRKEFLLHWSAHSLTIEQPWGPALRPNSAAFCYFEWERLCLLQGRGWFRRAKTTADTWLGGSPHFCLFKKCSYCWCLFVCLFACWFVFILWRFSIQTSLTFLVKTKLTYWNWERILFFVF